MQRKIIAPRANYQKKLEEQGLSFHSWDGYWKEDACYSFSAKEIDYLEEVTAELHSMCLTAARFAVAQNRLSQMAIPVEFHEAVRQSLERDDFSLYGRFDLAFDGKVAKMLEYNADTPTSLLESAVCQWFWLEDTFPMHDQFNSLHDKLVAQWEKLAGIGPVHIASLKENEEDWVCTTYLQDTLLQNERTGTHMYVEDIGWDPERKQFFDADNQPIETLFKLYPWEWLMREEFSKHIPESKTRFIEPLWKSLLSNKALLPILWEIYPNHPNLLPAYFEDGHLTEYAKKPIFSREGANVELVSNGKVLAKDSGNYGEEGYIYQGLCQLPQFKDEVTNTTKYAVIGSWIVGDEPAGICIREDISPITTNMSNFVPHYFEEESC